MGIKAFDWKLDENGDYDFSSGDFEIVESSLIHLENLIGSVTADYKFAPQFGVNLNSFLNGELENSNIALSRSIKDNMKRDGFRTTNLLVKGDIASNTLNIKTKGERIR
jgi:hypothetical protein